MEITLSNLKPKLGSKHKLKRIGCGEGSGHGGSGSTRGMKGQRSRSGEGKNPGFEGGQMPLLRRLPKRGFTNKRFKKEYQEVSIENILKRIPKDIVEITPQVLKDYNLIKSLQLPIKILSSVSQQEIETKRKIKLYFHKCSRKIFELIKKFGWDYVQLNN